MFSESDSESAKSHITDQATTRPAKEQDPPPPYNDQKTDTSLSARFPTYKVAAIERFKSIIGPKQKQPAIIFPPPSWAIEDLENSRATGSGTAPIPGGLKPLPIEDVPEPKTLAHRIRALIDSLPLPGSDHDHAPPAKPTEAGDGTAHPPPGWSLVDPKLRAMLSSEAIMNGSLGKGTQSVWSALDHLRHGTRAAEGGEKKVEDEDVMMYAPLEPTADTDVELAETEVVTGGEETEAEGEKSDKGGSKIETVGSRKGETSPRKRTKKAKERTVWVPSTTKISLQATWWGYRLYLPPPVLAALDSTHIVAAQRAAMVTTALKYLLDRIPILMVPPQFRPAIKLLKRLAPYLGYVGGFIAWSWGTIKKHDQGDGVVLTATWLLPVALVPATWNTSKVPSNKASSEARKPARVVKDG